MPRGWMPSRADTDRACCSRWAGSCTDRDSRCSSARCASWTAGWVIGTGPLEAGLRALAEAEGVSDRVTLVGEVQNSEVAPFFAAADVFVLPSIARSEAFGIVQLEAMASGTPVVNTALDSGVPWVSQAGVTGLTVPPGDPRALGAALERLLNDRALCERFGGAARGAPARSSTCGSWATASRGFTPMRSPEAHADDGEARAGHRVRRPASSSRPRSGL